VLKTELIHRVADLKLRLRLGDAEKIVSTIIEEITAAMVRGDRVELRGIGAFSVRARRGRPGRNPGSGTSIVVPAKLHPHFRPGKEMRERLNRSLPE
jgi:integration host factor subunit beta